MNIITYRALITFVLLAFATSAHSMWEEGKCIVIDHALFEGASFEWSVSKKSGEVVLVPGTNLAYSGTEVALFNRDGEASVNMTFVPSEGMLSFGDIVQYKIFNVQPSEYSIIEASFRIVNSKMYLQSIGGPYKASCIERAKRG